MNDILDVIKHIDDPDMAVPVKQCEACGSTVWRHKEHFQCVDCGSLSTSFGGSYPILAPGGETSGPSASFLATIDEAKGRIERARKRLEFMK